jgi:hypothetical protein
MALLFRKQVVPQNFKNVGLVGMGKYLFIDLEDGTPVATLFAPTAAQVDLVLQLVFCKERFDDFQVPVVAATEAGTPHADDNLLFHRKKSPQIVQNASGGRIEWLQNNRFAYEIKNLTNLLMIFFAHPPPGGRQSVSPQLASRSSFPQACSCWQEL